MLATPKVPLMMRQVAAPGAPWPLWLVMVNCIDVPIDQRGPHGVSKAGWRRG